MAEGSVPTEGGKNKSPDTSIASDDLINEGDLDSPSESLEQIQDIPGEENADSLLDDLMPPDAGELEMGENESLPDAGSPVGMEAGVDLMEEESGNLNMPMIGDEGDLEIGSEALNVDLMEEEPGNLNLPPIGDEGDLEIGSEALNVDLMEEEPGNLNLPPIGDEGNMEIESEALNLNAGSSAATPKSMNTNTKKAGLGNGALDMNTIRNIKVDVQAVLGGISMSVSKLSHLKEGELVSLEKNIGEEIEILANGQLIAHGEIVVIEGDTPKFGITLTSIVGSGSHK